MAGSLYSYLSSNAHLLTVPNKHSLASLLAIVNLAEAVISGDCLIQYGPCGGSRKPYSLLCYYNKNNSNFSINNNTEVIKRFVYVT